ncbi:acyltransferase family protein [Fusibacillus kribbianus]|uniref:Acyltransferase 3 domain-containing protein n=1 Tax=Fusibacillus kribbianus TaxID=3044208 RepID=A0AAP4BBN9_9FIRM|nr:acyltransferase family protein [Ruminococcus sp. YH-rum2234]MDI9241626.1 hypothetical protein [Ruminococcus sp. YH-rum2234]
MQPNQSSAPRNYLFDNIKALMLFFVAFGHTLDVYLASGTFEMTLMKYIYLFHMPMFAFITGYFSKDLDKARNGAVQKCLVPYLLFQGLYIAMANAMIAMGLASFNSDVFQSSILLPSSAFYYLLAVFFWKLSAKDIFRFRYPVVLSLLLGLFISITSHQDFHQGLGAVFSLLFFFVLGVLCTDAAIRKIRSIPRWISVVILIAGILPAYYLPYAIHSVRMTYQSVGFTNVEGILYRLIFYGIALIMGTAIINLVPEKKSFISRIGEASILVYAGSTFLAPHAYVLLARLLGLEQNRFVNMICMTGFCLVLVFLCSLPIFVCWYRKLLQVINRLLFKN